jgi:hypothetical protein
MSHCICVHTGALMVGIARMDRLVCRGALVLAVASACWFTDHRVSQLNSNVSLKCDQDAAPGSRGAGGLGEPAMALPLERRPGLVQPPLRDLGVAGDRCQAGVAELVGVEGLISRPR